MTYELVTYGKLGEDIENDCTYELITYPTTITQAYTMLVDFNMDILSIRLIGDTEEAVSLITGVKDEDKKINTLHKDNSNIKCYN